MTLIVRRSDFGRTPHALLEAKLGVYANAVFAALSYHDRKNDGLVYPSLATLADLSGISINSVRKALQTLATAGWVEIRERSRKGCMVCAEYRLNYTPKSTSTVSPCDTVDDPREHPTISPSDTVKNPHGIKIDGFTVSPGDTEEEEENKKSVFASQERAPTQLTLSNGHEARPTARAPSAAELKPLVKAGFDYFLEKTGRHIDQYKFNKNRPSQGLAGFQALVKFAMGRADPDPLARAALMFRVAVDRMCASRFHSGENESGMRYQDWHNLFSGRGHRSPDKLLEFWLDERRWKGLDRPSRTTREIAAPLAVVKVGGAA